MKAIFFIHDEVVTDSRFIQSVNANGSPCYHIVPTVSLCSFGVIFGRVFEIVIYHSLGSIPLNIHLLSIIRVDIDVPMILESQA